jgi:hypothetical protein
MNRVLVHKKSVASYAKTIKDLDNLILQKDQKHYLERKVKFLLDIRGYLKTNTISGSYVEFGSYKSEMQYSAFKILNSSANLTKYIGLDTFEGEPDKKSSDKKITYFDSQGDFYCDYESVKKFVDKFIGEKGLVLKGDFRDKKILHQVKGYLPIAVSVIDCNLLSSVKSAMDFTLSNIANGGIIFFDDFFYNIEIMKTVMKTLHKQSCQIIEHNFYPPFAKSFVVIK